MKIIKQILLNPSVKSVVLGLIVLAIGALCSFLGGWDNINISFIVKGLSALVLSVVYAILLVFYSRNEVNDRKIRGILEQKVSAFETLMIGIVSVCKRNSTDINTAIHSIVEDGFINLKLWNFDRACVWTCNEIYKMLTFLTNGNKDFCVAYVKLIEGNDSDSKKYIMMNAFANQNMLKPSVYNMQRVLNDSDPNTYHDVELFLKEQSDIEIIIGHEQINDVFAYRTKERRVKNKQKYNQYIAIPVYCNDTKMIGLLEVACYNEASLGVTEREIHETTSKYLVPYSYLLLLLHKMEKALITQPTK